MYVFIILVIKYIKLFIKLYYRTNIKIIFYLNIIFTYYMYNYINF